MTLDLQKSTFGGSNAGIEKANSSSISLCEFGDRPPNWLKLSCHFEWEISKLNHLSSWIYSTKITSRLVFCLHLCDHWYVHLCSLAEQLWDICLGSRSQLHRPKSQYDALLQVFHKCIYRICRTHSEYKRNHKADDVSSFCHPWIHSHQPPSPFPFKAQNIASQENVPESLTHHKIQSFGKGSGILVIKFSPFQEKSWGS